MTDYKIEEGLVFQSINSGGWKQVDFFPTPNQGGLMRPKFLVIHYTAGAMDAHGTAAYFQKPEAKVSAHLNLSRDGTLTQSVSLETKAYHAGKSTWAGINNLNDCSIGIEVCNPGPLSITKGGYKTWWGANWPADNVIEAPHQNNPSGPVYGWEMFTPEQNEVLLALGKVIVERFKIVEVVGHDMISPGRKTDPGPAMNHRIYDQLNNSRADDNISFSWYVSKVNDYLNGRSGPGTNYSVVMQLPKGTELDIISKRGEWWFVENPTGQQMWVHSRFLGSRIVDSRINK